MLLILINISILGRINFQIGLRESIEHCKDDHGNIHPALNTDKQIILVGICKIESDFKSFRIAFIFVGHWWTPSMNECPLGVRIMGAEDMVPITPNQLLMNNLAVSVEDDEPNVTVDSIVLVWCDKKSKMILMAWSGLLKIRMRLRNKNELSLPYESKYLREMWIVIQRLVKRFFLILMEGVYQINPKQVLEFI